VLAPNHLLMTLIRFPKYRMLHIHSVSLMCIENISYKLNIVLTSYYEQTYIGDL
jgi:hypothetical protein